MSDTPPPAAGWRQGPDGKWYGPDDEVPTAHTDEEAPGTVRAQPAPTEQVLPGREQTPHPDGGATTTRRRLFVIGGIAAAVVVGAVLLAVIATGQGGEPKLTGDFTLTDTDSVIGTAESCSGTGGYSDFGPGMNVTVRNGAGEIVASGQTEGLDAENFLDTDASEESESGDGSPREVAEQMFDLLGCTVVFEVEVPTEDFYIIEAGRRGELSYSRGELEELDWNVSLSLGD